MFWLSSLCKKTAVPCGNGLPDAGEKCDDGNFFSGDGCSNACQIETGYICTLATPTRPSQCVIYNNSTDNRSKGLTPSIPMVNSKNVFVILTTDKAFTFANTAEMTSFIKYEFLPAMLLLLDTAARRSLHQRPSIACSTTQVSQQKFTR